MKTLSSEMISLLDRVYNLRSDDSVILSSMADEKQEAMKVRDSACEEKNNLEKLISDLKAEKEALSKDGNDLLNILNSIGKKDYSDVTSHLNIDFDPQELKEQIENNLPSEIEKIDNEQNQNEIKLADVEDTMSDSIARIEELDFRKEEAEADRDKLNYYFSLALDSNSNMTRDEVNSLLSKFNFTNEEQKEVAKILMFPEDGLFDYEEEYRNREVSGKSIGEVIQEAKEINTVIEDSEETSQVSPGYSVNFEDFELINQEEETVENQDFISPINFDNVNNEAGETNVSESSQSDLKNDIENLFRELEIDLSKFTNDDYEKIISNFDEKLIRNNIEIAKKYNISIDIFDDNIELLYDVELEDKISTLVGVGKQINDIYLNPEVLIKYNLDELNSAINVLKESGLEPKLVPLIAY